MFGGSGSRDHPHGTDHAAQFRDLVGTQEVGACEQGEHSEKGFCGADFLLEKLEGVGEGLADRPAEGAETECVEEGLDLIAHALCAVGEVLVVEAEAGIDPEAFDPAVHGALDFPFEVAEQDAGVIRVQAEVPGITGVVGFLDVAKDDARLVFCGGPVEGFGVASCGEVDDGGARGEAVLGELDVVAFDGHENFVGAERLDDGGEARGLFGGGDALGVQQGGLGTEVDEARPLGGQAAAPSNGGLRIEYDAFAVPGIGGKIHHAHERDLGPWGEGDAPEFERLNFRVEAGGVALKEPGEREQVQHARQGGFLRWQSGGKKAGAVRKGGMGKPPVWGIGKWERGL
ncbi:MAG: hypothetical protein RLZZ142_2075 [Verrucomicrobiota bacterium]